MKNLWELIQEMNAGNKMESDLQLATDITGLELDELQQFCTAEITADIYSSSW
ncbi:hypothetical protein IW492_01100 [Enterococcus sp. BWB1-3]|uniref:hypothetical protein n=1 Tax=unclassified Enterococcus TaxID=2608891 RepID=UPI001923B41E|nr:MULTISPECIES: hypothetical protein [unclassified Enterococcus]MBL1227826.1 hypothetical protein [Enterococcus sp. BWB1-3]MCB5953317.1 hypothetical protein [Enterococcus sp. BWT-B8]